MRQRLFGALIVLALATGAGVCQMFTQQGAFAVEVSLENSALPRLAMYRNAITSLEIEGDYAIGGTSAKPGLSPYLFAVSLSKRELQMVVPLDEAIAGQRAIPSGFGRGADRSLYAGTLPQSKDGTGHLIRVAIQGRQLKVADFGTPSPGEGVFTLTEDPKRNMIYGLTYPSGRFFRFDLSDRKTTLYAETSPDNGALKELSEHALNADDYLSRRLVIDRAGRVYGSCPLGGLFRYDPADNTIEIRRDVLPTVSGHRGLARVDAWAVAPDGTIYGSNAADGQLFTLNPSNGQIVNLGKPIMMPRMKGMAFGPDGVLYGVAGGSRGYTHVFTYKPGGGFTDFGNPLFPMKAPGIEQGIPWRGFQIATVAASQDGHYIVMGEDEALSQLLVFLPESRKHPFTETAE